ncbi:MAG: hypothetical protein Kow00102_14180 [Spirochaetota bacterium]
MKIKKVPVEVYSRIVGYFRPVNQWNMGKQEEFRERKEFTLKDLYTSLRKMIPEACKSCLFYDFQGSCTLHNKLSKQCKDHILRPGISHK